MKIDEAVIEIEKLMKYRGTMPEEGQLREILSSLKNTKPNEILLPTGTIIWWEDNEAGGRTYYSDAIGNGVVVWDTCLASELELLTVLRKEKELQVIESQKKNPHVNQETLTKILKDMGNGTIS